MHLDHHRPRTRFPDEANRYANLYLSCPECNEAKGSLWPTAEEQEGGRRFLDVCEDVATEHLRVKGVRAEAHKESPVGRFMIAVLDLNGVVHLERRRTLVEARENLRRVRRMTKDVMTLAAGSPVRARLLRYLELDRRRCEEILGMGPPVDAPESCAC